MTFFTYTQYIVFSPITFPCPAHPLPFNIAPPFSVPVHVLGIVGGGVSPNELLLVVSRNTMIACLQECRHLTSDLPVENFFPSVLATYKPPWKS